jgi:hypothetical protein
MRSNACAKRSSDVNVGKGARELESLPNTRGSAVRSGCTTRANVQGHGYHEMMHPFVNHLVNASGSISRIPRQARNPTNQLLFNCSIQWTTKRRRSSGDFTGKSLAFSISSMGNACRVLDQRR